MKKYENVYIDIIKKIQNNEFKDGKLPAEKDLEIEYNCSRQTIKTAMSILLEEGIIFRRKGKGTFIRNNFFDYQKNLNEAYIKHESDKKTYNKNIILSFEVIKSNETITKLLNLKTPENVYHFRRLRFIDDIPETLEDTYIPIKLLPSLEEKDLEGSFFKYIKKHLKLNIESTYKNFILQRPNSEIKDILKVDDNDFIVLSNDFVALEDGNIIAGGQVYYSPRKFEFSSIITTKSPIQNT